MHVRFAPRPARPRGFRGPAGPGAHRPDRTAGTGRIRHRIARTGGSELRGRSLSLDGSEVVSDAPYPAVAIVTALALTPNGWIGVFR